MNRKKYLANIWKFSAKKAVAFMLIIPTVGSLVVLSTFYLYLNQTQDDVLFTNVAGRQRLLSKQLRTYTHTVHDLGRGEDREPLRELVATFDQSLVTLDQGGEIMGRKLSPAPPEIRDKINLVKELWQDIKPALVLVADQPTSSPQAVKANDFIKINIPLLGDLSNEVVFSFELLSRNQKEQIFRILITVLSINFVLLFAGVLITKRYLADRKKNFRNIFQSVPESLLVLNDKLEVLNLNKAFEELIRKYAPVLMTSEDELQKTILSQLQQGFSQKKHGIVEIDKRMEKLILEFDFAGKLFAEEEEEEAIIVSLKDITERVESRKQLEVALEKAQEGERMKSLFMANMSHEIRTPLNAIMGFTNLIEMSTRNLVSEEEKGFFDIVKKSGTRLLHTVHEILDISQIEAGTYNLYMEHLDLCTLVKNLVQEFEMIATQKGLELVYEAELETAIIEVDQLGISQAISNIIDNAIKYTDQGKITVLLEQKPKHYVLSIRDTGIGIAEDYLNKLYEVFSQESEGYTKKYQGIGLGMSIAKRHLDLNHIAVKVESTKGVGTTFTLTFPEDPSDKSVNKRITEKRVEKEEVEITSTAEPIEKPLVLLVEDDPDTHKLMGVFLRDQYEIDVADSVAGAKQKMKKNSPELVLLDLSLVGNEDGLDLVRWMRKTKTWKKTPVVATTAHAFTKDKENCIVAGCNDYLSKPMNREKLLEKISKLV